MGTGYIWHIAILPVIYMSELFLNALKPASYNVLIDLFNEKSHNTLTTLTNTTIDLKAVDTARIECCPWC